MKNQAINEIKKHFGEKVPTQKELNDFSDTISEEYGFNKDLFRKEVECEICFELPFAVKL